MSSRWRIYYTAEKTCERIRYWGELDGAEQRAKSHCHERVDKPPLQRTNQ